ncbi:uncharacterized protein LOC144376454 [Ictidomys tridecemlineatus]
MGKQKSDAARAVTCGADIDPAPPPGKAARNAAGNPKRRRENTQLGPVSPSWNLPSTVFFLKRDAMVGDRARAARLGPVRPETRKGKKGKDRPLAWGGGATEQKEKGRVATQDPWRACIREDTAAASRGAQVTGN